MSTFGLTEKRASKIAYDGCNLCEVFACRFYAIRLNGKILRVFGRCSGHLIVASMPGITEVSRGDALAFEVHDA